MEVVVDHQELFLEDEEEEEEYMVVLRTSILFFPYI